jgi:transposase
LTQYARLLAARRVEQGHKPGEVAKQLGVSRQTVYKWVRRFREEGAGGLADRSSRPRCSPRRTPLEVELRIVAARVSEHAGANVLAGLLGLPASTIGVVLRRWELPRLAEVDRLTGEVVRRRATEVRYERRRPGELLHVDVKKLGRVPDGGGWRVHGRGVDDHRRKRGWDYVHVAVDDRTRLAYAEVLPDEKGTTCAAFLHRAAHWFHHTHGVTIERILTDNAKTYRLSRDWAAVCGALQIKRRFTKVRCPWTNGKRSGSTGPCRPNGPTPHPGPATTSAPPP